MNQTAPERLWAGSVVVAGGLVGLIAGLRLVTGLLAVGQPAQWDYGEPIVYGQALRLLHAEPLYQPLDRPPYTVAAYTPLYYVAAAGVQAVFGAGFAPGRLLSYAAGLAAALGVARLGAQAARSHWAGLFAAVGFLALGFSGAVPWFALYRVDVLGVALAVWAIAVLSTARHPRQVVWAGALAGLAILTKQSLFAAAVAGTLWLWRTSRPRTGVLYAATALLVAAVPCTLLEVSSHAFMANTVAANLNPLGFGMVAYLLPSLEASLGPPLVLAGLGLLGPVVSARHPSHGLLAWYWLVSLVPLLGLFKVGAFYNYWIEPAASTLVLATLAIWDLPAVYRTRLSRLLALVPLWLLVLDLSSIGARLVLDAPATLWETTSALEASHQTDFAHLVEQVRTAPGPVLADPLDVVVLAGRPVLLEPVIFGIFSRQGTWDAAPLVRRICDGDVRLLVLQLPLERVADEAPFGEPWWPEAVARALQARMQPVGNVADRLLYAPSAAPPTAVICR